MNKLSIGLIGCGRWAQTAHVPLLRHSSAVNKIVVSGVITENEGKDLVKKLGLTKYVHDWRKIAESPSIDAVIISTPHQLHYEQIKDCLLHGKHVHVDKPPTLSYYQFKEVREIAQRNNLIFSVHAQMKYMPGVLRLKHSIESNFSSIYQVNGYFWQKLFDDFSGSWRSNPALSGGGIMVDSGYHTIDTIHYLLNTFQPSEPNFLSHAGTRNASDTVGLLTYRQDSTIVSVSAIRGAPKATQRQRIEIFGDGGYIEFRLQKGANEERVTIQYQKMDGSHEEYEYTVTDEYLSDPLRMFLEVITTGNSHMYDEIERNLNISGSAVKVLDGAYREPKGEKLV